MTQRSHHPAFDPLNARLHLGLVLRMHDARRHHREAIGHGEILVGRIQVWFVAARRSHGRLGVVRGDDLIDATEELKGPDVRGNPLPYVHREAGLDVGVVARALRRNEQVGGDGFARLRIRHRHRRADVVHKQVFASLVLLAIRYLQRSRPSPIQLTEPAIVIAVGVMLLVLLPEQREGHSLATQFPVDHRPLRQRTHFRSSDHRKQQRFQAILIQVRGVTATTIPPLGRELHTPEPSYNQCRTPAQWRDGSSASRSVTVVFP